MTVLLHYYIIRLVMRSYSFVSSDLVCSFNCIYLIVLCLAVYANRVLNEFERGRQPSDIDWTQHSMSIGMTLELCAGIVDKNEMPLVQVMKEEICEECGYDVPIDRISVITKFRFVSHFH